MPTGRRRAMEAIMKKLGSEVGLSFLKEHTDLFDSFWYPESDEEDDKEEVPTDEYDREMKKLQENVKKIQTFGRTEEE